MSPKFSTILAKPATVPLAVCLLALLLAGCAASQHHRNGMNALEKGDLAKGVAELQLAANLAPQDVKFRTEWLRNRELAVQRLLSDAENAHVTGSLEAAEDAYRTILKFERGNARATAGLEKLLRLKLAVSDAGQARAALARGEERQALELSARALENDPHQADAIAVRREIDTKQAQQFVSAPTLDAIYKKPVNLEFRDASVRMVFDALSRTTGINFIFDRDARTDQRTTVFLRQTTLEDAIDVILTTNQLEKKILNSTSVLIYSAGAKSKEYQDLVVRAFYLASADAKNTANLLRTVLKIKDVFVDEKINMLVLRETPDTIALAEKLIGLHDLDQPEVMLEVEVLEVNRSRLLDLGIKVTDKLTVTPLNAANFTLGDLTSISKSELAVTAPSATANFNADNRNTNLLANPRIRVRDREKARFMIGDKVPVVTTTNTPNGFSSENITYQDVGLKLEVEPEVHIRDEIGLRLSMEVSSLVSSIKTNNGSIAYQIGSRSVSSVLRLKDGETQVLAGLISDEDRSSANGLPFLNELPVLGRLFAAKQDSRIKTEIVLSITPRLIRTMQRKEPGAESFWSGTEASLRLKPMQLRTFNPAPLPSAPLAPGAGGGTAIPAAGGVGQATASGAVALPLAAPSTVALAGPPQLRWIGPAKAKPGAAVALELRLDSQAALRAAPVQLGFDPAVFKVISVKEGDFFSQHGASHFGYNVDATSGRISVSSTHGGGQGASGEGGLLVIELMPLQAGASSIQVLAATPMGMEQEGAVNALPLSHKIVVAP